MPWPPPRAYGNPAMRFPAAIAAWTSGGADGGAIAIPSRTSAVRPGTRRYTYGSGPAHPASQGFDAGDLPSMDELAAEVERFLRDQDGD